MDSILIGLSVYMSVMLLIGLYSTKKVKSATDFIVAGKKLSLPFCTATLAATWFGGGICIGAASAAYKGGFLAVIADPFGAALCLFLAGLFYVRVLRRMGIMTIASFFGSRYDRRASLVASLCTIPAYIGWVASLMVAFGRILQSLTAIDPTISIIIAGVAVIIYTVGGGMWAVTLTDLIQITILVLGLLIITPILLNDVGGWDTLAKQIPSERFNLYPQVSDSSVWFAYMRDWLVIGLGNLAGQDLIQRSLSSKNEKVAYQSAYLAGILYVTIGLIPVFLGLAGSVLFPELSNPDLIMMKMAITYLPDVALIIFTGALISALLSSADSALLAPASVIGWDLLRYFRPNAADSTTVTISRISVVICGLFSIWLALQSGSVYDLMVNSWSVLLATLFVPLTAGIWWSKANTPGCLSSIFVGFTSWQLFPFVVQDLPADLLAVLPATIALISVSYITKKEEPAKPLSDSSGDPIDLKNRIGLGIFDKIEDHAKFSTHTINSNNAGEGQS